MAKEGGSRATTLRLLRVSSQNSPGDRIVGLEGHPRRRHCRRATYELPLLLRLRAGRRRARAASDGRGRGSRGARSRILEQLVGLGDAQLPPWTGFATAQSD